MHDFRKLHHIIITILIDLFAFIHFVFFAALQILTELQIKVLAIRYLRKCILHYTNVWNAYKLIM